MRPALDSVMQKLYTSYAAGQIPLAKLPTVARMKEVMGGLGGKWQVSSKWDPMLEKHHLVPKYVQKYFDDLNPNHTLPRKANGTIDFDQCPGLTLWWQEHRGAGDSVHGLMRGVIPDKVNPPPFNNSQELFDALDTFYDQTLKRPGAAMAIREFLNQHGLP